MTYSKKLELIPKFRVVMPHRFGRHLVLCSRRWCLAVMSSMQQQQQQECTSLLAIHHPTIRCTLVNRCLHTDQPMCLQCHLPCHKGSRRQQRTASQL